MKFKRLGQIALASAVALGGIGAVAELQPSKVEAASLSGISSNTTKANYYWGTDANVTLVTKNDNTFGTTSFIYPQKYVNGTWQDLDWWTSADLAPEQTQRDDFSISSAGDFTAKGTYRFKVETLYGNNQSLGSFYTSTFYVK